MSPANTEFVVSLEQLDDRLKNIVKIKIREFIHLSPWFSDVPTIDLNQYMRLESVEKYTPKRESPLECPNTHRPKIRRRHQRLVTF